MKSNGNIEDLAAEIGFTAACRLVAWFGGGNLYVPITADENHGLAKVIGYPAFRSLVENNAGQVLWIGSQLGVEAELIRRNREVAQMFIEGKGSRAIAEATGLTERRVQQLRLFLETIGHLPEILAEGNCTLENAQ